jgi:hypothetical protein
VQCCDHILTFVLITVQDPKLSTPVGAVLVAPTKPIGALEDVKVSTVYFPLLAQFNAYHQHTVDEQIVL